mmetsp:Transcript_16562/g.42736  ORF Transcript_16562/g.42736 Transcript_16562/m.42736 type:complete len:381 (+) Transcript_16562:329-1471(+)
MPLCRCSVDTATVRQRVAQARARRGHQDADALDVLVLLLLPQRRQIAQATDAQATDARPQRRDAVGGFVVAAALGGLAAGAGGLGRSGQAALELRLCGNLGVLCLLPDCRELSLELLDPPIRLRRGRLCRRHDSGGDGGIGRGRGLRGGAGCLGLLRGGGQTALEILDPLFAVLQPFREVRLHRRCRRRRGGGGGSNSCGRGLLRSGGACRLGILRGDGQVALELLDPLFAGRQPLREVRLHRCSRRRGGSSGGSRCIRGLRGSGGACGLNILGGGGQTALELLPVRRCGGLGGVCPNAGGGKPALKLLGMALAVRQPLRHVRDPPLTVVSGLEQVRLRVGQLPPQVLGLLLATGGLAHDLLQCLEDAARAVHVLESARC